MVVGGFLRNGSCLLRSSLSRSIADSATTCSGPGGTTAASVLGRRNQQHCRPYNSRHEHFSNKPKELQLSPSHISSRFASSWSSLSSSSAKLLNWYLGMLKDRPILTKSFTASFIYTAADLSAQIIAGPSSESLDFVRTLRMAGYGMLILGPSLHFWFNFVSRVFPKRDVITTLKKIIMAQTLYGPVMTTFFFSVNACLQGEKGTEIIARLKRDLLPTMMNGAIYWPFCDFLTFKFFPVQLQPLVSNSFSYLWTIYITYMASLETPEV